MLPAPESFGTHCAAWECLVYWIQELDAVSVSARLFASLQLWLVPGAGNY